MAGRRVATVLVMLGLMAGCGGQTSGGAPVRDAPVGGDATATGDDTANVPAEAPTGVAHTRATEAPTNVATEEPADIPTEVPTEVRTELPPQSPTASPTVAETPASGESGQ